MAMKIKQGLATLENIRVNHEQIKYPAGLRFLVDILYEFLKNEKKAMIFFFFHFKENHKTMQYEMGALGGFYCESNHWVYINKVIFSK